MTRLRARCAALVTAILPGCSLFVSLDGLDDGSASHDGGSVIDATRHDAAVDGHRSAMDASVDVTRRDTGTTRPDVSADAAQTVEAAADAGKDASVNAYVQAVLSDSPYAYWRLEETTGLHAADQMGTVHVGDIGGGVTLDQPGIVGRAMEFDGQTACIGIESGDDFRFPGTAAFTVELWVKLSSFTTFRYAMSTEETNEPSRFGWTVGLFPGVATDLEGWNANAVDGGFIFGAYSANGTAPTFPLNTWTYLVGTYDGATGAAQIFVNGKLESYPMGGRDLADAGSLALGCSNFELPIGSVNGLLDEVAIYRGVLAGTSIFNHYAAASAQ